VSRMTEHEMSEFERPGLFGRPGAGWWRRYWQRRLDRMRAELERNRRGDPAIPTWVLAVALVVIVGGIVTIVIIA
jgi:hypothetical protein